MLRRLLSRLWPGNTDHGESAEEQGDEHGDADSDDEGGFLRSRLDASVLHSHGMGDRTVEVDESGVSEEEAEALEQYHDEQ